MKVKLFAAAALLCVCTFAQAQIAYKWTPVPIDSTWDEIKDPAATLAIARYQEQLGPLQEILGYSVDEYSKDRPESGLSNLAADIIRDVAGKASGREVDIAMTNFGGIRTSIPKGAVRVYDIFSIFPFDNSLVYFDIKGSDLRSVLMKMIGRNRIEALSNVRIEVRDGKVIRLDVAGAPLDDARTYRFATINFLMDGGDGVTLKDLAKNYVDTGIWVRDAIAQYFRDTYQDKKPIELHPDGRVRVDNKERRDRR